MQREPEIVKILREEERLKNSQAQTNSYNKPLVTSDEETVNDADESTVLCIPSSRSPEVFPSDFLQTVYRTAFEIIPFAILVLDTHQRILSCNAYTESFLGKTNQELYLKHISVLHSPEEWQKIKQQLDDQPGFKHQIETTILLKNNRTADVMILSCALKNSNGNDFGYLYIIKNNIDQKRSEHQIDSLIQDTENSIFLVDAAGQYLMTNSQLLSLLGQPREDVLGKTFSDFHSYEETKEFFEKLSWVFENGVPRKDVYCFQDRWYVRTINPVKEPISSQTTVALVIVTEINQKALAVDKTFGTEKKYFTLFNCFPQTTLLVDQNGTVLEVNERITEWTGYTPEEVTANVLSDLPVFTKESKKSLQKIFSKRYLNKTIPPFEIELQTRHGGKRTGLVCVSNLRDDKGDVSKYLVTISEYPKHNHRNDALRIKDKSITALGETPTESEKRFQVVLENSLDMIYQIDQKKGTYDYVSPSSIKIIGYTPKEINSFTLKKMEEMIHPEDIARWNQHFQMITDQQQKQNAIRSIEYRFNHKTRGYRWLRDTCTALFDGKNEPVSIIGTIEDITDRKKVWEELVKSEEKYRILA